MCPWASPSGQRFCRTVPIAQVTAAPSASRLPKRRATQEREVLSEEQRQAGDSQHERPDLARGDFLAQQPRRQRHRPHRHREREDRRAPRRDHREAERDHHVPAGHVEEREDRELRPRSAWGTRRSFPEARATPNRISDPKNTHRLRKDPGREIGQRDLHRRPVESPREREPDEGPPKLRRHALMVGRGHRCGMITVAIAADTSASAA